MSSSASSSIAAAPSPIATAATPEAVPRSPEAITETYVATWNETDPARRRAGIAAAWAEAGTYRDPVMARATATPASMPCDSPRLSSQGL